MLDPLVLKLVASGFGLLFLLGAVHKLSGLQRFRAILGAYQVLPGSLTAAASVVLPVFEALLGAAWLLGIWPRQVALTSAALLACYTLSIALNLKRGRIHIDCGCSMGSHAGKDQQLSSALVVRNVILIGTALIATLPAAERAVGVLDYVTLVAGLISVVFLYGAANQLLSNNAAIGVWRNRHD